MTPVFTLCTAANGWVAKGAIPVHRELKIGVSGMMKFVFMRALGRVNMKMKDYGRGNKH
jgi:hypothetical protein